MLHCNKVPPRAPLKNNLLRKILAAGGLTRSGKLMEATAAIQRALSVVPAARAAPATPSPPDAAAPADLASVLDGFVRDVKSNLRAANDSAATTVVDAPPVPVAPVAPVVKPDEPDEPRFVASSFTGAAGTRAFKLFEPAGFADAPLPLVVMLHGCTQDPDDFAAGTRMNELAQEQGFFVLYPAQAPRSNAHKCWNWFTPGDQRRGMGEPSLIAGMTRHVLQTYPIDGKRVYVAGLSAGGAMAAILAREYPDLFAAAGIHSGVPAGAAHDVASAFAVMKAGPSAAPARPAATAPMPAGAPVIVFHGNADTTVAAANGDALIAGVLAAEPTVVRDASAGIEAGKRGFQRIVWRRADAAATAPSLAEQWIVQGAPHAWSGGAVAGSFTDPSGPDASREMMRFFQEHPAVRPAG
jgi:poly(hydroxyalkanoate) depolymerase family esterase